ncbi:hypothetical protein [Azospirillum brasilense]|uniref:hypothetical protein n=1 Tax=Azospirillum brasilense TaxID=192 RepID=UPI000E679B43|nr:hypothetical protein [Azospirillum brasilense]NUB24727.1 hypothetical protein [Azospirillum brasilense]NUB30669.1 hypothetical protein [Azospirillum brasilense]RIW08279.1 hypothetical protein D2T81_00780 [Azospirillum brasilense]
MVRRYDDIEDYVRDLEDRFGVQLQVVFSEYGDSIENPPPCSAEEQIDEMKTLLRSCPCCGQRRLQVVGIDPDWAPDWHGPVAKLRCRSCGWTRTGEVSI